MVICEVLQPEVESIEFFNVNSLATLKASFFNIGSEMIIHFAVVFMNPRPYLSITFLISILLFHVQVLSRHFPLVVSKCSYFLAQTSSTFFTSHREMHVYLHYK